jgi:hypothetical protein
VKAQAAKEVLRTASHRMFGPGGCYALEVAKCDLKLINMPMNKTAMVLN